MSFFFVESPFGCFPYRHRPSTPPPPASCILQTKTIPVADTHPSDTSLSTSYTTENLIGARFGNCNDNISYSNYKTDLFASEHKDVASLAGG